MPQKVTEICPDAAAFGSLASFPFSSSPMTLTNLKSELIDYLAKAADVSQDVGVLEWWKLHKDDLPHWTSAAQLVVLV